MNVAKFRSVGLLCSILSGGGGTVWSAEASIGPGLWDPSVAMVDHTFEIGPSVTDVGFKGNFVVARRAADTWSVSQRLSQFQASGAPVVPGTRSAVPDSLWDFDVGSCYVHAYEDRRSWAASLEGGSASDKLFYSTHEASVRAGVSYEIPSGDRNAWIFFVTYSNNRSFANNVPLPGAAYLYHSPGGAWDALLGVPYAAVHYQPNSHWSGRASIAGPTTCSADWGYQLTPHVRLFAGYAWGQNEWLVAGRTDDSQRLFFDQKKWILGTQTRLFKIIALELDGAYEFDRRFYNDTRARNSGIPEIGVPAGWAFQGRLTVRLGKSEKTTGATRARDKTIEAE